MVPGADFDLPFNPGDPGCATEHAPPAFVATGSLGQFGELLCEWITDVRAEFEAVVRL